MNFKKITSLLIGIVIVFLSIYDIFAIMKEGTEASISHTIVVWSYKFPAFTFGFGFLCGHFFWRVRNTKELE